MFGRILWPALVIAFIADLVVDRAFGNAAVNLVNVGVVVTPGEATPSPTVTATATPTPTLSPTPTATALLPARLVVHPTNARWVQTVTGQDVWLTGSHTWSNLMDRNTPYVTGAFPWDDYLAAIVSQGHTFIRLWGGWADTTGRVAYPQPFLRDGVTLAPDDANMDATYGAGTWTKYDLTQRNPEYFDRVRARVIEAGQRGLYVGVMLFQAAGQSYGAGSSEWSFNPYNATMNINGIDMDPDDDNDSDLFCSTSSTGGFVAAQKRYIDWVLDAVNDLPNVIYESANEIGCALQAEILAWNEMVFTHLRAGMAARGMTHLVWTTDGHVNGYPMAGNTSMYNSTADLVSPTRVEGAWTSSIDQMKDGRCEGGSNDEGNCHVQSDCPNGGVCEYMPPPGALQFSALPVKPSLLDNDHLQCIYEPDNPNSVCLPNTSPYGIVSGPEWVWKATIRGYMPIYMDGWGRGDPPTTDYSNDGNNHGDPGTRLAMGDARSYMGRMMPLATVVPVTTMSSTKLALRDAGTHWLLYQPGSGSFTVDLATGADAATTFAVEWWDVIDRVVKRGDRGTSTVTGGATRTLTPPSTITGPVVALLAAIPPTQTPPIATGVRPTPTATPTVTGVTATPMPVPAKDWSARWWHFFGTRSAPTELYPAS